MSITWEIDNNINYVKCVIKNKNMVYDITWLDNKLHSRYVCKVNDFDEFFVYYHLTGYVYNYSINDEWSRIYDNREIIDISLSPKGEQDFIGYSVDKMIELFGKHPNCILVKVT
jgi:hypothetical protein